MVARLAADGTLLGVSPHTRALLGEVPAALVGSSLPALIAAEDRHVVELALQRIASGSEYELVRAQMLTQDARPLRCELALQPLFAAPDRARELLLIAREQVDDAPPAELESLIRHEIRAPLEGIIALAERGLASDAQRQQECVLGMRGHANALLSRVDLVLDMTRMAAGRLLLERAPFELDRMMESALAVVAPLAGERELALFVDPELPAQLMGDRVRLCRVLVNVVTSALEGTTRPGALAVRVEQVDRTAEAMLLRFSVRAPGLHGAPLLASDGADEPLGASLGLAVSRELVQRMGGSFAPLAEETLRFELPLGFAAQHRPLRETLIGTGELRALVVDDEEHVREPMTHTLLALGLTVSGVASAGEGVNELRRAELSGQPYQLAFATLRANGTGRELARRLEHGPRLSTQLVLMSSKREHSSELASARMVRTPLGRAGLIALIRELASVHATRRQGQPDATPTATALAPSRAEPLSGISVLVVEDNEINQILARDMLETLGAQVTLASEGQRALELTGERTFDVILMDVQMPGMDGHATTRAMRALPRTASTPIIAMTAHAFDTERKKCLASGMNAHVSKPINPGELVKSLLTWARRDGAPAMSAPPTPPTPPPDFDPTALGAVFRDPARQLSFLRKFVDSAHTTLSELHGAWQRRAEGDISFAGHKLKSSAKACGAHALATVCADLERHAKDGDWDNLAPLEGRAEQLLAELTRYVEAVEAAQRQG
jgi:two-component system sensor histidine kinase/response regulator